MTIIDTALALAQSAANLFGPDITDPKPAPTPDHARPEDSRPGQVPDRPAENGDSNATSGETPEKPEKTDPGAGQHASRDPTSEDHFFKAAVSSAAQVADQLGLDNASRHLLHYLGNSGSDLNVDPAQIASDVPQFEQAIQQTVDEQVNAAIEQAVANGKYGEPIAFDSGWTGFYIGKEMSADWFYAIGGVQYRVTGTVTVSPGDPPTAQVEYQHHVYDRYNWDEGKSTNIGPVTIEDRQMAELHRAGLAQEYDIVGSSKPLQYQATYHADGGSTGASDPAGNDRK